MGVTTGRLQRLNQLQRYPAIHLCTLPACHRHLAHNVCTQLQHSRTTAATNTACTKSNPPTQHQLKHPAPPQPENQILSLGPAHAYPQAVNDDSERSPYGRWYRCIARDPVNVRIQWHRHDAPDHAHSNLCTQLHQPALPYSPHPHKRQRSSAVTCGLV